MKVIESSSNRKIWIGKTITKEVATDKELDQNELVLRALQSVGFYQLVAIDRKMKLVTYDFIEGKENVEVIGYDKIKKLIETYGDKKSKVDLPTIRDYHKHMTGFVWTDTMRSYIKDSEMEYIAHQDISKVNIIQKLDGGYTLIDWEHAALAPKYYDYGSYTMIQTLNRIWSKGAKKEDDINKIIYSEFDRLSKSPEYKKLLQFTYINTAWWISYKELSRNWRSNVHGIPLMFLMVRALEKLLGIPEKDQVTYKFKIR